MSIFQLGDFILASGKKSCWKIECDSLSSSDWNCLALLGVGMLPPFGSVIGVPRGGLLFAEALQRYATVGPRLVVDDVYTTGKSINKIMEDNDTDIGLVAFARSQPSRRVTPIFILYSEIERW